jgi:hypothetical protein
MKNVAAELRALGRMTAVELRLKYKEIFGEESRSSNRDFLRKRLAWRIQSLAEGGLTERALRRAQELANDADIRIRAPRGESFPSPPAAGDTVVSRIPMSPDRRLPLPGTVLTRRYRGETIQVVVLDDGKFEYDGQVFRSLTAVAQAVTGTHWNGYHFFFGPRRKGAAS